MEALVHLAICSFAQRSYRLVVCQLGLAKFDGAFYLLILNHALQARVENLSLIGQVLADFEMQRVSVVTHGINTVHIVIIFHLSALSNIHG